MAWVNSTETESAGDYELAKSLINQLPRNSSQTTRLLEECTEERAQTIRYLARCRTELNAGGHLRNIKRVDC